MCMYMWVLLPTHSIKSCWSRTEGKCKILVNKSSWLTGLKRIVSLIGGLKKIVSLIKQLRIRKQRGNHHFIKPMKYIYNNNYFLGTRRKWTSENYILAIMVYQLMFWPWSSHTLHLESATWIGGPPCNMVWAQEFWCFDHVQCNLWVGKY